MISSPTPISSSRPKYRADVDGMRALAILSVLFFHAYPTSVPGGFIGVDIFFVISGYLISSIIFRGLTLGTFSFFDFYARRVRRIFPAVTVVLVGSFLLGFYFLTPYELVDLVRESPYAAFFLENWRLYVTTGGYWETATELQPFMHFWSLGVEEQYYIFYPLICFLLWKLSPRWFLASLCFMLLVSLGLCLYDTQNEPVRAFYSLHSRFWELLIGGVLAYVELKWPDYKKVSLKQDSIDNVLSLIGIGLIVLSIIFFEEGVGFPGWRALLPTVGSVLIIAAGGKAYLNKYVLSNRILVFIGLISYPLYLWHWPFICIFKNNLAGETPSGLLMVLLIAASFLMAYITYTLVERPLRSHNANWQLVITLFFVLLLVSVGSKFAVRKSELVEQWLFSDVPQKVQIDRRELPNSERKDAMCVNKFGDQSMFCRTHGETPHMVIIGDSHARFMWLNDGKQPINTAFYLVANDGGFIFEDAYRKTREDGYADAVKQIWEALRRDSEINTVILRGYWGSYLRETFVSEKNNNWTVEEKFINHWRHVFSELERLNKKVILILDNPPYPNGSLSRCVPLQRIRLLPVVNECTFDYTSIDEEHVKAKAILEKEAKSWSNVTIIDLEKIFCKNGKCMVTSGDQIYYRDEDHLSTDGNKLVWDFILSKLSH